MKDMIDPLSAYSGVRWSAPDDATIEGESPAPPFPLRYTKAKRRLRLRLTEISARETWSEPSGDDATVPERKLTGRGELSEVLTVFELGGGLVCQFRDVREIRIVPAPVNPCADGTGQYQDDPDRPGTAGSGGVLFIDFEPLAVHGEHNEPALSLSVTMRSAEFQRTFSLVHGRADEIREVTLVLNADLFGDGAEPDDARGGWSPEYGMLRPPEAPLVFSQARLERMEVLLERPRVLGSGPVAPAQPAQDHLLGRRDQPNDGSSIIVRRLGWIIALLVVMIVILLSNVDRTEGITRIPRQFAESPLSSISGMRLVPPPAGHVRQAGVNSRMA